MNFQLTTRDYIEFLNRAHARIHADGAYITALDAATGDGDHWTNLDKGFEKLLAMSDEMEGLSLFALFRKIGITMMSVIGGSSGVLYGTAYMEAAKVAKNLEVLQNQDVCNMLEAMGRGIMERGKSEPGMKTMLDALHPAIMCYKECIAEGKSEMQTVTLVKQAAKDGAESTKDMEAIRGRAYYQGDKGVGHLDPGAVTMSYQIETLMDIITEIIA